MKSNRPFYVVSLDLLRKITEEIQAHGKISDLSVICRYVGQIEATLQILRQSDLPVPQQREIDSEIARLKVYQTTTSLVEEMRLEIMRQRSSKIGIDSGAYFHQPR